MSDIEPGKHFVITLIKGEDESPRDYVSRCNAIAAFARERSSTETPTAATSLDHFTQVSETAYEIVTPGYQSTEETGNERDTHFEGFASLQWDDIEALLRKYGRIPVGQMVEPDFFPEVKALLAQHAYDIAFHALAHMPASKRAEYGDVPDCLEHVPDLTEWPEQSE